MWRDRLYDDPELLTFEAADRERLIQTLDEQDQSTVVFSIDSPEQVLLSPDRVTLRGEHRFSSVSFKQLCRTVCPGLSNVVTDVAGNRRIKDEADRDRFSTADAILVLNTVVRRRFRTSLEGMQLIRDTRTGMIEGLVGRNYRRLSNLDMFNRSDAALKLYRRPVEFYQSRLYGRYMVLCYRDIEPAFHLQDDEDPFYNGFYYSNSETGDGSLRATTTLIRAKHDNKSLGFYGSRGRLIHTGKDFQRRFELLLNEVAEKRPDADKLMDGLVRLTATPLGFGGTDDDNEKRFTELVSSLRSKQVTHSIAKKIMRSVLLQGSFDEKPIADIRYVRRDVWPTRTLYDLFNAMTRVSKELPIMLQERIEQMAHSLILGRINLTK